MSPEDKRMTAYHEGGHALLFYYLPDLDPLYKVTIIPHGNAGGVTMGLPEDDNPYYKFVSIREIDPKGTFDAGEGSSSSGAPAVVDPISYPDSDPQPMPDIHIASSSSVGTDALSVAARQSFSVIAVERSLVISSSVAKNVAVFDMQGRVVFSRRGFAEKASIPVRNPGSYLVMVDGITQIVNVR